MAPAFFSKLVKSNQSPSHSRDNSRRSFDSLRRGRTPSPARSKIAAPTTTNATAVPSIVINNAQRQSDERGRVVGAQKSSRSPSPTPSFQPIVTIIPPSPRSASRSGWSNSSEDGTRNGDESDVHPDTPQTAVKDLSNASEPQTAKGAPPPKSPSKPPSSVSDNTTSNPSNPPAGKTATAPLKPPPLSHASSTGNLRGELVQRTNTGSSSPSILTLELPSLLRRKSSNRSIKVPPPISITNGRSQGTQALRSSTEDSNTTEVAPVVESPSSLTSPNPFSDSNTSGMKIRVPDSDAASLHSVISNHPVPPSSAPITPANSKKKSWRRGSTPNRKPTGLASAIAASSMTIAMANNPVAVPHLTLSTPTSNGPKNNPSRKATANLSSPMKQRPRTPSASSRGTHSRHTSSSLLVSVEANSDLYIDDREYSALEDDSSDSDSDSSGALSGLDIEEDIPVTGFAVASPKRNADFHELFPSIPEGDYLIEDYGCALQREILIQGRLYISENHICFHSNIFGWVTDLSVPVSEVLTLEKKMTAYVIPNAIQITTPRSKYTFASLLARDTTYDVIYNVWRLARPEDTPSLIGSPPSSARRSLDTGRRGFDEPRPNGVVQEVVIQRKATQCECGRTGKHFSETALDTTLPGTPDRIHNLMFASGFIKDFMKEDQKLLDIQISDWSPMEGDPLLLTRNMSYIRPLTASIGPKQTKCEIRDETLHSDVDTSIVMLTTTRTPDVPSGGVFSVKTRTCIMWAGGVSTRLIVTTQVEWTGRSFIKGIIEKSAIDGQKTYHAELDKAMRAYIQQHQSEFVPAGVDPAVLPPATPDLAPATTDASTEAATKPSDGGPASADGTDERKQREHERNLRGLQWAWDTFEGASQVARQSAHGALDLIAETWEHSTSTTICIAIIILLVFSNLWTLFRMGGREEVGRLKEMRKTEEREKWVQGIVRALWDELSAGGKGVPGSQAGLVLGTADGVAGVPLPNVSWQEEIAALAKTLDEVEERVRRARESLNSLD